MKEIKIDTKTIKLDQLLKFAGITQTGGHSKMIVKDGIVKVNGEKVEERGRQIKKGDIIEIQGIDKLIVV